MRQLILVRVIREIRGLIHSDQKHACKEPLITRMTLINFITCFPIRVIGEIRGLNIVELTKIESKKNLS